MQEKTDKKLEVLRKRESERRLDYQSRKDDRNLLNAENEKTEFFKDSFDEKKVDILLAIEASKEVPPKERSEHFDKLFKDILTLQKYVAASNIFLRTYDIKIYQECIQDLTNQAKELEAELIPKKKFGFKNKKTKPKINGKSVTKLNGHNSFKVILDENYCGFRNEINKTLKLQGEEVLKKDVTLTNLTGCTVRIFGAPSTVHMSNVNNCKIFSGPVSTSVFADACLDSTLVISCQQLRLHSSKNVHIYLHVTSRAIMEDCNKIYIAPYNLTYEGINEDYEQSGLDRNINNWESVDDFNWLNTDKASPHWTILDENKRVSDFFIGPE